MNKKSARIRRATRARYKFYKLKKTRLVVHRTNRHIYAQIISPNNLKILVVSSTTEKNIKKTLKYTGNKEAASFIGRLIGERALKEGIKKVSFDSSGFKYHGRVQALADAARKTGLKF